MALHMRTKNVLAITLTVFISVIGNNAHARSESMSFDQKIISSDYVIVGTIIDLNSKKSKVGNMYTVAEIGNVSVLAASGELPIDDHLPVYFIGGVMPNPNYKPGNGTFKFKMSYLSGTPYLNTGDELILFISGNGDNYLPFVGDDAGVLRVSKDGYVTLGDGRAITSLGPELGVGVASGKKPVQLISSSSQVDEITQFQGKDDGRKVSVPDLIDYVVEVRSKSGFKESLGINDLVNVTPTVEYFQQ